MEGIKELDEMIEFEMKEQFKIKFTAYKQKLKKCIQNNKEKQLKLKQNLKEEIKNCDYTTLCLLRAKICNYNVETDYFSHFDYLQYFMEKGEIDFCLEIIERELYSRIMNKNYK